MIAPDLTGISGREPPRLRFPEHHVIARVAAFLKHAVAPRCWQAVLNIASTISRNSIPIPGSRRLCGDIEQVIRESQPMGTFAPGFEELEYLAAWLVNFLYQCGADHDTCLELLRNGMRLEAERRSAAA